MLMKNLLFFLLLVISIGKLDAQIWAIPNQYDDKVQTGKNTAQQEFYQFRFTSNTIDLKTYKKQTGLVHLPDEIEILPPALYGYGDTTILMTYMKEGTADDGQLIIWLTGNYLSNEVTFFVDKNLDGNYNNDGKPIVQKSKAKPITVVMQSAVGDTKKRVLSIAVPERKLPAKYLPPKRYAKIRNKIAIGANAGIGIANLDFIFDNTETMFPTWYNVPITELNLGLSLTYNSRLFFIGATGGMQSMNYWTAYFNTRFDEDQVIRNPITGRLMTVENVDIERNLDRHSKTRYRLGGILGLRLSVSKNLEIQPFGRYGTTFYGSKYYYPNKFKPEVRFEHDSSKFVEGGIRFEFSVSNYKTFYIGTSYTKLWWRPSGYFESLPVSNLEIDYHAFNFSLGYRMGL